MATKSWFTNILDTTLNPAPGFQWGTEETGSPMDYATFKTKYQNGYGLNTSTKLTDAYSKYKLTGVLPVAIGTTVTPAAAAPAATTTTTTTAPTTPTTTTPTTTTPSVEEQMALMPQAPTPVAPALAPMPTVTPASIVEAPTVPVMPAITPAPTIAAPVVTPAPEYKPTAEEQAWSGMTGGEIKSIIEARGLGIDQPTQDLMIRQQTQALTAREDENLRLMANDMERRGITNSGLLFWNTEKIKSATTTAIAASITDIQIKSSLMKMASFENALGQAGQFLGYLQEQSKMVYTGKMATWEAQTQADLIQYQAQISVDLDQWKMENQYNLVGWQANTEAIFAAWDKNSTSMVEAWKMANQFNIAEWETQANYDLAVFQIKTQATMANWAAKMDIYKLGINQAYQQANMNLAAQIDSAAASQQHIWDVEMAEMEIEANQKAAAAEGGGKIVGTLLGGLLSLITG